MSVKRGKRPAWERYLPIRRTKLRSYLIAIGVLIGVFNFNQIEVVPFAVGVLSIALASLVHVWAKGHLDKNRTLTRSGPYRWVRDPFHLANFFIDLGLCLVINNWIFTLVMMSFWVIAYRYRLNEEHEMLVELFGDDYLDYQARIPRMIPYKPPMDKKYDKPFSVKNGPIYRGGVCTRLFRFASYPYLLFAAAQIGDYGWAVFEMDRHPLFFWALSGFVFFHFAGEAASLITRKRKSILPLWMLRQPVPAMFAVTLVGALLAVERLPLDTAVLELHLGVAGAAFVAVMLILALALACPPRLWSSYRFRRLVEGVLLSVLCLFTPLPWLALAPACYYTAAFLYGDPAQQETDVDHVFIATQDTNLLSVPRYMGLLVLVFFAVETPVLIG